MLKRQHRKKEQKGVVHNGITVIIFYRHTRTKDEEKKSEKKVEKKTPNYAGSQSIPKKKTPNYAGSQSIPKKAEKKKEEPKKSKSFLDRVKEDFSKAVKETKRNFSGDFKKGTGRYKSISTGKTNFNKKKKKAS